MATVSSTNTSNVACTPPPDSWEKSGSSSVSAPAPVGPAMTVGSTNIHGANPLNVPPTTLASHPAPSATAASISKLSTELKNLTLEVSQLQQMLHREQIERLKLVDEYHKRDEDMVKRLNLLFEQLKQASAAPRPNGTSEGGSAGHEREGDSSERQRPRERERTRERAREPVSAASGSSSDSDKSGEYADARAYPRARRASSAARRSRSTDARRPSSSNGQANSHRRPSRPEMAAGMMQHPNGGPGVPKGMRFVRGAQAPLLTRSRSSDYEWDEEHHMPGHPTPFGRYSHDFHPLMDDEAEGEFYMYTENGHQFTARDRPRYESDYPHPTTNRRYTMEDALWGGPWPPGRMLAAAAAGPPLGAPPPPHGLSSPPDSRQHGFMRRYPPNASNHFPPSSRFHSLPDPPPQMGYI